MPAGKLDKRVAFDAPVSTSNGAGGTRRGWSASELATTRWSNIIWLRGGETVAAARLSGRQPVIVTVRRDSETLLIETDWRCRYDGMVGAVRSIQPSDDRADLEIMVEFGVAP